ncbi:MAG: 50S ribosomal protein L10 [Pseudomonadota bacterium]
MDRAGKAEAIKTLEGVIADSGSVIVARYTGLSVAEMTEFRGKLREQGAVAKVVKNRLFKKALNGKGGDAADAMFVDQTLIAYAEDPVAAAKGASEFAKDNDKLVIIGGLMGDEILDTAGVEALSKMPSREEQIATIVARLLGQASQIGQRLNAPGQGLAGAINVIGEKAAA